MNLAAFRHRWIVLLIFLGAAAAQVPPVAAQELRERSSVQVDLAKKGTFVYLCLAITSDGKLLASGNSDGALQLWDVENRKLRSTLKGHGGLHVSSLQFTPDDKTLISAGFDH